MGKTIHLYEDADKLKAEILRFVPLGTPVDNAKHFFESNGFDCSIVTNGIFYEAVDGVSLRHQHEGLDFLYVKYFKRKIIGSATWQLALPFDNQNRVVNIIISFHKLSEP